ncbi:MAG: hypothetical protein KAR54_02225 [Candidatus Pacebacteria bacterium]|nr:hypothetical protein [Candidatus Paceibacterota bacterium]
MFFLTLLDGTNITQSEFRNNLNSNGYSLDLSPPLYMGDKVDIFYFVKNNGNPFCKFQIVFTKDKTYSYPRSSEEKNFLRLLKDCSIF